MSLGLVAYGSSDESDNDEETNQTVETVVSRSAGNVLVGANKSASVGHGSCAQSSNLESNSVPVTGFNNLNTSAKNTLCSVALNSVTDQISDDESEDVSELNSSAQPDSVRKSKDKEPPILSLPPPKTNKLHNIDFDWSQLSKKKSTMPIKITVPSLADLSSEEGSEQVKKKLKPSKVGSGLFALLPSPKNGYSSKTSLRPQQIKSKVKTVPSIKQNATKKIVSDSKKIQLINKTPLSLDDYDSPDEGDEFENSGGVDFFSLSSPVKVSESEIQVPDDVELFTGGEGKLSENKFYVPNNPSAMKTNIEDNDRVNMSACGSYASNSLSSTIESNAPFVGPSASSIPMQIAQEEDDDLQLDQTALQQLCGRRERHTGGSNVQFIDIKGDTILPDAREWMTKQLTEEQSLIGHSHKKKDGPTTQQRRKHQITYLAFQAKEHELELKNQWANNRMSRKQTQAKYGF